MKIKLTPYDVIFGEIGGIDGPVIVLDINPTEEEKIQLLNSIENHVFYIKETS